MTVTHSGFAAVCFDCDSTLTRVEGIDELARRAGCEAAIAELTNAAMTGEIPLEDIYATRLARVRPDRAALDWLAERYIDETVCGAPELISTLHSLGKAVYVLSGGLFPPVAAFADALGVPLSRVHAVAVQLGADGSYAGFDAASPLTRHDGKSAICNAIRAEHGPVAMVGDAVTDLATRESGAYVVGFGGVVHRAIVQREADAYVAGPSLMSVLDVLLTEEEKTRL